MSYHIFNNLSVLLNRYLSAKIGQAILSIDLMDRECDCFLPSKVNVKCVYEDKFQKKHLQLIYEVKWSMCEAIYISNTHHTFKKIMDGNFSNLLCLLKNGQKSDSFAAHFWQHFDATTLRTGLRKYIAFKVIKQLNPIGEMKIFTKPNCNLCMEEFLTILKNLRDKHATVINKEYEIYGACQHKTTLNFF